MTRILIGALACHAYPERRERCRSTWAADTDRREEVDLVFLLGGATGPARRDGQNLYLPCQDDFPSRPQKVRLFLRWALQHSDFDYLFKCDDDTYVHLDRLLRFETQGRDYIAVEWSPSGEYASGGAGYFLSRRAAVIAARGLQAHATGADDALVGEALGKAGIPLPASDRFPPIVSCRPQGRLGNVMFQVAAALGYSALHSTHQPVFDAALFTEGQRNTFFRKLTFGELPKEPMTVPDAADFTFNASIPAWPTKSVLFTGYHQSEKYFSHCADLIRETFEIPEETKQELDARHGAILREEPVCVHVRRGDYLNQQERHPVQPASYYLRGLKHIDREIGARPVLCVSDDPDWCRDHLQAVDSRIKVVSGQDEYRDLALMSLCSHFVISNSSFSWWGAWLGSCADKIVIIPDQHFGAAYSHYSQADIYPESWLPISAVLDNDERHPRER